MRTLTRRAFMQKSAGLACASLLIPHWLKERLHHGCRPELHELPLHRRRTQNGRLGRLLRSRAGGWLEKHVCGDGPDVAARKRGLPAKPPLKTPRRLLLILSPGIRLIPQQKPSQTEPVLFSNKDLESQLFFRLTMSRCGLGKTAGTCLLCHPKLDSGSPRTWLLARMRSQNRRLPKESGFGMTISTDG